MIHLKTSTNAPTSLKRGLKDRKQTNEVRNRSILHPGLGEDRFGQLRVKAAFGPGYTGATRP